MSNISYALIFSLILCHFISASKIRKMIDFLDNDAPKVVERIPNYNEESLSFKRDKNFDPCKENSKICSNNGKCLSKDGNFYCLCPVTHYGKTCEHIADQTNCEKHLCQNNATCVRCICRNGYFGTLCEVSEELKKCEEEYCLGRGKGDLKNGSCSCSCDKMYFGVRCEQISTCYETECSNAATCIDKIDEKQRTISADCQCPKTIEIIGGTVEGASCETVHVSETVGEEMKPCSKGFNSSAFFENLKKRISTKFPNDIKELEIIRTNYFTRNGSRSEMSNGWCENNGKCVPEIVKLSSNNFYYIHRCDCTDPLTDGYYCEYKRNDACDLTRQELENGVRWDEKCTDFSHGVCIEIHGKANCVCKPDYVGDHCELFDPCARNPCKRGDCIPIPDSSDLALGSAKYQCLCPLSAQLQGGVDCVPINDTKCETGACGNGRCVPCESPNPDDLMPLCNQAEFERGYRCICEAGFLPPNCRSHTNPCFQNLCQNSATCQVNDQRSYDCLCLNGTRGSLCEQIDDSCEAFGHGVCVNGECINDAYYHRGFACQCFPGYEGLDCEIPLSMSESIYHRLTKHYQFTVPLICCALSLLILLFLSATTRQKRMITNV